MLGQDHLSDRVLVVSLTEDVQASLQTNVHNLTLLKVLAADARSLTAKMPR